MLRVEEGYLKCSECNLNFPITQLPKNFDPLKIIHDCKKTEENKYNRFKRVGIVKKAINYTKATVKHKQAGKKETEPELHKIRLEVCNTCDHGDNKECFICGCDIPVKASWSEQSCPLYKWPRRMTDLVYRNNKQPANLKNTYFNAGCFFIGSGPSLEKIDLSLLKNRGILSFAVNNVAAFPGIKPNFWCCTDNPNSFHQAIWTDPSIIKFVRAANAEKVDYPNLYSFDVNEDFKVETFFEEPTIAFGNHTDLIDAYGQKGGRSVIYCSFRLMYYLGIRRIYLIGCDFKMDESRPYVFNQQKWKGGVSTNNKHYEIMNIRFKHLNEKAKTLGLKFYNCSPESSLTAFDHLDFNEAIKRETIETPKTLANMYG